MNYIDYSLSLFLNKREKPRWRVSSVRQFSKEPLIKKDSKLTVFSFLLLSIAPAAIHTWGGNEFNHCESRSKQFRKKNRIKENKWRWEWGDCRLKEAALTKSYSRLSEWVGLKPTVTFSISILTTTYHKPFSSFSFQTDDQRWRESRGEILFHWFVPQLFPSSSFISGRLKQSANKQKSFLKIRACYEIFLRFVDRIVYRIPVHWVLKYEVLRR